MPLHPEPNSSFDPAAAAIDQSAADWVVRAERGLTTEEEQALSAWLEADERHRDAFAELNEGWDRLNLLRFARPAPAARAQPRPGRHLGLALGAAAALALITYGAWSTFTHQNYHRSVMTAAAEEISLALPDGSQVRLHPSTALDISFTSAGRDVQLLRGEALFTVAHDVKRPFVVVSGTVAVKAVGTVFDVHRQADSIEVAVTEGRVKVVDTAKGTSFLGSGTGTATPLLVAGQRAVISDRPAARAVSLVTAGDSSVASADHRHRLEFFSVPLSDMVREFNRYNPIKLVIADERLAAERFGGTFYAEDSEPLVRMLESNFSVSARQEDGRIVLSGGR